MSRQDKPPTSPIETGLSDTPIDDDLQQIDLRLGLDEIAAAEEERLRASPRRRPSRRELIQLAGKLYDARRGRDRIFNGELFGEPAWDMMLALYYLPSKGIFLGITSLGHAANVAPTTGLRWQKVLLANRLIERGPEVSDSRQRLVRLTDDGRRLMDRYLLRLFYCDQATFEDGR